MSALGPACRGDQMSAGEVTHFAPYGATNALCEETVPRLIPWDASTGDYVSVRFTTRRDRTTCQDCRTRLGLGPVDPAPQMDEDAVEVRARELVARARYIYGATDLLHWDLADMVEALLAARRDVAQAARQVEDDEIDPEVFCPRCAAGVDSSEHHEKCVLSGHAADGEPALAAQPAVASAERVVRPEVFPSCGSGSAFEVRPPCSLDAFDPDAWHSPSSWRQAEPVVVVEHHMDIEAHASSFSEGFETAVAQGLADDPALAAEWLAQHDREVASRALLEAATVAVTTGIPRTFLGDPDVDSFEVEASRRGLVAAWLCERANRAALGELTPLAEGGDRS